ncbi:glutamate 5-kinase [Salinicoccus roseus]|uniref:Glutamate 5-kinase n=1 Tax=Salinicoccus roseus TaxID=45670 RepID=A0A0C2HMI9_9STAP|nr:glutamate 5-kinase [Salinicoccus roseus]KIH70761.1 glutamate 5-kinase [Salinicoccus roseus]MDB0580398.1 glutamate 5-kinase [Salinicoccus roseus]
MDRNFLKDSKRVVIKIGTNSIMKTTDEIDYHKLDRLSFVCSALQQQGKEVILVTSGAVGVGACTLNMKEYPEKTSDLQALASVGQGALMNLYSRFFQHYDQYVGQILMTRDIIDFPISYTNCKSAINSLLERKIIPVINENDAISVDEKTYNRRFGENDTLAAIVTELVDADLLIILSDVDGLYDENPHTNEFAKLIPAVGQVDTDILSMANGTGSLFSTGGMETKLKAAKYLIENNKSMIITSAENPALIFNILEGDEIGTLFKKNILETALQGEEI